MLAHQMSVAEIAERLGHAEAPSFTHAFKRWTGASPGSYRRRGRATAGPRRSGSRQPG